MNGGIIYIDKPAGVTSRYVDNRIQKIFHIKKVGHLGTLDPFATGLLVVAVNEATKCLPFYPDEEKTYVAELVLGKKTSTGDKDGEIVENKEIPSLNKEDVEKVLFSFLGEYAQLPPMTSSIHLDGKRLYELAHQGIEVKRERRLCEIMEIKLLSLSVDTIVFIATVSKGTYIRTLGEDIAERLGTVGYLTNLRRVKVGDLTLDEAIPLDEVKEDCLRDPYGLIPYRRVKLMGAEVKKALNGVRLSLPYEDERILVEGDSPIAIYEKSGEDYVCLRGIA